MQIYVFVYQMFKFSLGSYEILYLLYHKEKTFVYIHCDLNMGIWIYSVHLLSILKAACSACYKWEPHSLENSLGYPKVGKFYSVWSILHLWAVNL